jgi:DNA (cytosine-5)-methyltransferase 1
MSTSSQSQRRPTAISLFAGAGGLDIGFAEAGFDLRLAVDNDPNCVSTLILNGFDNVWHADIADSAVVTPRRILALAGLRAGDVDAVIGGPPCQPFSMPGRRRGLRDSRAKLLRRFCSLVAGLKPRVFVIENVSAILTKPMRGVPRLIRRELGKSGELKNSGYEMEFSSLNSASYGVPQLRHRVFIVGWRGPGVFYFPPATHYLPGHQPNPKVRLKRYQTVNDAFRGLPPADRPSLQARRVAGTIAARNQKWHGK